MIHTVFNPKGVGAVPSVVAIGNFDGVHLGHHALLKQLTATAKHYGVPSVVITFEPHPRFVLTPDSAPPRLTSLRDKICELATAGVDKIVVVPFTKKVATLSASKFLQRIHDDGILICHLIVGDDFRFGAKRQAGIESLQNNQVKKTQFDITVVKDVCDTCEKISSTRIRSLLKSGKLSEAAALMGRPFFISGKVCEGKKIGRTLGFPTANLKTGRWGIPLSGVFAVKVRLPDGKYAAGIANVGRRPTIADNQPVNIEVHLLDIECALYNQCITVYFLKKIRDEQHFDSLFALQTAIKQDKERAKAYFKLNPVNSLNG